MCQEHWSQLHHEAFHWISPKRPRWIQSTKRLGRKWAENKLLQAKTKRPNSKTLKRQTQENGCVDFRYTNNITYVNFIPDDILIFLRNVQIVSFKIRLNRFYILYHVWWFFSQSIKNLEWRRKKKHTAKQIWAKKKHTHTLPMQTKTVVICDQNVKDK